MDTPNLPAAPVAGGALLRLQEAVGAGVAPALAIMLDESLFAQVQKIASIMAKADGFVPAHLVGKPDVCFAVATRSLVWRLDPFAVAQSTYKPTEDGKISYEAKLVQAIIEQSGRLVGGFTREYYGDGWNKVQGKFRIIEKEKEYKSKYQGGQSYKKMIRVQERAWTDEDEDGLGVRVSVQIRGEDKPREVELDLRQAHPRNSTLWVTDPKTQLYYRAVRMLGNVACPSLLMGVPFMGEEPADDEESRFRRARDVTGEAERNAVRGSAPPCDDVVLVDPDGEERAFAPGEVEGVIRGWCAECTDEQLALLIENNPDSGALLAAVEAEQQRRVARAQQRKTAEDKGGDGEGSQTDPDPLKIAGKGQQAAVRAIEDAIRAADAGRADQLWRVYRDKVRTIDPELHTKLEQIVLDKIAGNDGRLV